MFDLSKLEKGKSVVGSRWVYATNLIDADGNVNQKARYVAKGYSQKENVDYMEPFSTTAHMTSVRMLIQIAVNEDMVIHQMDVKTAYLNAPIDCDIHVKQPEGYKVLDDNGAELVWHLKKLYGLKQSGRNWNNDLNDFLISEGLTQSQADPCVYSKGKETQKLLSYFGLMIIS